MYRITTLEGSNTASTWANKAEVGFQYDETLAKCEAMNVRATELEIETRYEVQEIVLAQRSSR